MKKIVVLLLMVVVSSGAIAGWMRVGEYGEMTVYADRINIRMQGEMVKMWHLIDYKSPQKDGSDPPFLSAKIHAEYDCNLKKNRELFMAWHSGNMGDGATTDTLNQIQPWTQISPKTVGETLWKLACRKQSQ